MRDGGAGHFGFVTKHLKPAHTRFVDLIDLVPPILPNRRKLGLSDLGETTDLHRPSFRREEPARGA